MTSLFSLTSTPMMAGVITSGLGLAGFAMNRAYGALRGAGTGAVAHVEARTQALTASVLTETTRQSEALLGQIETRMTALARSLPQTAIGSTKLAVTKEIAKYLLDFIESAKAKVSEDIKTNEATGLPRLFREQATLQALIANPTSTPEQITLALQTLTEAAQNAEIYIHGFSIRSQTSEQAPTTAELSSLLNGPEAAAPVQTDAQLEAEFDKQITKLTTCLRRKIEIDSVLSESASRDLLALLNTDNEAAYLNMFNSEIRRKVNSSSLPAFIRPILVMFLKIQRFMTGLVVGFVTRQIKQTLKESIRSFISQDPSRVMDFFSKAFFEGLNVYNNEIINASIEIAHKTADLQGTPSMMIEEILKSKKSLHAGCLNQEEFYKKVFEVVLNNTVSWSFIRYIVRKIVYKLDVLKDPFRSVPQTVRDANGFQYNLDKSIINLVSPVLKDLQSQEEAIADDAEHPPIRNFSQQNKDALAKALKTLFKSIDLNNASDATEISLVITKARSEASILSPDQIIQSTAEAGALAVLESLNKLVTPRFLLERTVDTLKSLNNSFSAEAPVSEAEMSSTERKRKEVLDQLSQAIIHKAVDGAPILNSQKLQTKMNELMVLIKAKAENIKEQLTSDEEPTRDELLALIENLGQERKRIEELSERYSLNQSHKDGLSSAFDQINLYIQSYIQAGEDEERKTRAHQSFDAKLAGPVFAPKADVSIMNVDIVKNITKLGLNFILQEKFNKIYRYASDPKTVKYVGVHQSLTAILKA